MRTISVSMQSARVLLQRFSNCYISSQILAREHPERFKRFKQGGFTLQSSPASVTSLSFLTRCCPYRMSAAFRFLLGISSNKTCINRPQTVKKRLTHNLVPRAFPSKSPGDEVG